MLGWLAGLCPGTGWVSCTSQGRRSWEVETMGGTPRGSGRSWHPGQGRLLANVQCVAEAV